MTRAMADTIKVGDVILPPEREISLWMRRRVQEHNLSAAALHVTVTKIHEGMPDKGGAWLVVTTQHNDEWNMGLAPYPSTFKVRPGTPWTIISRAPVAA